MQRGRLPNSLEPGGWHRSKGERGAEGGGHWISDSAPRRILNGNRPSVLTKVCSDVANSNSNRNPVNSVHRHYNKNKKNLS